MNKLLSKSIISSEFKVQFKVSLRIRAYALTFNAVEISYNSIREDSKHFISNLFMAINAFFVWVNFNKAFFGFNTSTLYVKYFHFAD